ncbi:MAG: TetR/AcrR family transcriptional regulator [Fulvivirga sp.]|nr:TetR/AcrR family transcriptional regulator [Fulvivirga sp.]
MKLSLSEGRVNQKMQTRTKILRTAQQLMDKQMDLSLEMIAEKAGVSRATIYRYFANLEILMAEAALDIHHKSPEDLAKEVENMPVDQCILHIQKYYNDLAQIHENKFRRYLSAVLLESVSTNKNRLRGARRLKTLKNTLKAYKKTMSKSDYENLTTICSVLMGIESLIVTKDVCGLDNEKSQEALRWGIKKILQSV